MWLQMLSVVLLKWSSVRSELKCFFASFLNAENIFCRPCIMQHLLNSKQCFFCKADIESVREIEPLNNWLYLFIELDYKQLGLSSWLYGIVLFLLLIIFAVKVRLPINIIIIVWVCLFFITFNYTEHIFKHLIFVKNIIEIETWRISW